MTKIHDNKNLYIWAARVGWEATRLALLAPTAPLCVHEVVLVRINRSVVARGQVLKAHPDDEHPGEGTYRVSVPPQHEATVGEKPTVYLRAKRRWLERCRGSVPTNMPSAWARQIAEELELAGGAHEVRVFARAPALSPFPHLEGGQASRSNLVLLPELTTTAPTRAPANGEEQDNDARATRPGGEGREGGREEDERAEEQHGQFRRPSHPLPDQPATLESEGGVGRWGEGRPGGGERDEEAFHVVAVRKRLERAGGASGVRGWGRGCCARRGGRGGTRRQGRGRGGACAGRRRERGGAREGRRQAPASVSKPGRRRRSAGLVVVPRGAVFR